MVGDIVTHSHCTLQCGFGIPATVCPSGGRFGARFTGIEYRPILYSTPLKATYNFMKCKRVTESACEAVT